MDDLLKKALQVAKNYDVTTPKDSLVLYSVSFLPTKENRDKAFAYTAEHPGSMMIEHTPCGAKLVEMGLASSASSLSDEDVALVWKEASKRLIDQASGNITAFVAGADARSVFVSMELPSILANPEITTINQLPKAKFKVEPTIKEE